MGACSSLKTFVTIDVDMITRGGMPDGMANSGPPYLPSTWAVGGAPKLDVDAPITAIFLFLYLCGAITHMVIFQLNRRRDHKFIFSALMFGFCMARIVTCTMRIAAICKPHNTSLSIAASVFVAASVLLIFIINLLFTQRLIRAAHPSFGWNRIFSLSLKLLYILIVLTISMVITCTVQSFYTLRPRTRRIDRDFQLYGSIFFAIVSFLPIPMIALALILPRKTHIEKFGSGRFRTKVFVLLTASISVCLGAAFRCGTAWKTPVPRSQPLPAYYSRACFYVFNFVVEIIAVYLYAFLRVDLRFHIPDGARGPGSYAAGKRLGHMEDNKEASEGQRRFSRVYRGEETFNGLPDRKTRLNDVDEKCTRDARRKNMDEENAIGDYETSVGLNGVKTSPGHLPIGLPFS